MPAIKLRSGEKILKIHIFENGIYCLLFLNFFEFECYTNVAFGVAGCVAFCVSFIAAKSLPKFFKKI